MSALATVRQIDTRYKAIADDTLYLGDGRRRAIFGLHPPNLSLADDATLESTAQQLAGVFSSLPFATQLLFRFVAIDLNSHAAEAEQAGANRGPRVAAAARDYAALMRHLSRTLVLLQPHVYLAVGLEGASGSLLRVVWRAIGGIFGAIARCSRRLMRRRGRSFVARFRYGAARTAR